MIGQFILYHASSIQASKSANAQIRCSSNPSTLRFWQLHNFLGTFLIPTCLKYCFYEVDSKYIKHEPMLRSILPHLGKVIVFSGSKEHFAFILQLHGLAENEIWNGLPLKFKPWKFRAALLIFSLRNRLFTLFERTDSVAVAQNHDATATATDATWWKNLGGDTSSKMLFRKL